MRRLLLIAPILFSSLLLAASAERTEEMAFSIDPGTVVAVTTIDGTIRVLPSADAKIHVKARKRAVGTTDAKVQDVLDRVKIQAETSRGRMTISADIPTGAKGGGFWSSIFGRDVRVSVDYEIASPEGCSLDIEGVNGELYAEKLLDDLKMNSVNGSIKVLEHAGALHAETVNGSARVTFADPLTFGRVELSTVNGAVDLTLPEGSRGDVEASTLNGSIRNDFGLPLEKQLVGHEIDGHLGDGEKGGSRLDLSSINGSIWIRKAAKAATAEEATDAEPAKPAEPEEHPARSVQASDLPEM